MNEKHHGLHLLKQEGWVERFIRCQSRELKGEELPPEEAEFVLAVEATARTLPGMLEEALLEYGLTPAAPAIKSPVVMTSRPLKEAIARSGVAAATPEPELAYDRVIKANEEKREFVSVEVGGGALNVLQILSPDGPVKPVFQEGYTYVVEREATEPQTITPYGGVYLSLEELRRMFLEYNEKGRTIRLYHC